MGGQKHIALFCKYLGQQNTVTGVSVKDNEISEAENYNLILLFGNSRLRYVNPFYVKKIRKIIRTENVDNIITEQPYMAWIAWLLKRNGSLKWFVHSHNIEYQRFKTLGKWWFPLMKLYEKWAYSSADAVFFITPEDLHFAIDHSMVKPGNAILSPYGVEQETMPEDIMHSREIIFRRHNIPAGSALILFNGALSYKPNTDALKFILDDLNPILLQNKTFEYRILISGKDLPDSFAQLKNYGEKNVIYAGFVDDVVPYFKAADIFLNPITTGGGIKTKVVEAIGYGTTVISCKTGSAGINVTVCGEKIHIVPDNDANAFARAIFGVSGKKKATPQAYYEYYYWGNIIKRIQAVFDQ